MIARNFIQGVGRHHASHMHTWRRSRRFVACLIISRKLLRCVCVCVCVCVCLHVFVFIFCMHSDVGSTSAYRHYMHMYMYHVYVNIFLHIYIYIYIYIHTYVYTHIRFWSNSPVWIVTLPRMHGPVQLTNLHKHTYIYTLTCIFHAYVCVYLYIM
jgi:hypothetical protein